MKSLYDSADLTSAFFKCDPLLVAQELLGVELFYRGVGGIIIETEAYKARGDEACHTFFRPSSREFVAAHAAGTTYVYLNYGMYWLLNFLVKGPNAAEDGFVLIRGITPTKGIKQMQERRKAKKKAAQNPLSLAPLSNGPGKLTQALGITGSDHGINPLINPKWQLQKKSSITGEIIATPRIGISRATEYKWRFLLNLKN